MSTVSVLSELENFLRLTNKKETVVAGNMANVDTPGYHTRDFSFQQEFNRAMTQSELNPAATITEVAVHKAPGLLERADGNNVDLDRESMLMSETQLQYQVGTQLLKSRFHQLLSAIGGGGQ